MIKIFRYLKPYKLFVVLAPLFMFLEVLMDLMLPKLMANIIDIGIANHDFQYIIRTGLFMLLFSLIAVVGGVGCTIFATKASQNFGTDIRSDMFRNIQSFSFANLDKFSTASLITRLTNDIAVMQQMIQMLLRMMVRSPLLFVGGIIMAVSLNPRLSLIILVALPFLLVLLYFVITKGFPFFIIVQKKLDKLNLVIRENLTGVRVIKAFVRADVEKVKFEDANYDLRDTTIRAFSLISVMFPGMMIIMNVSIIAVLWFGGIQINQGTTQAGDVMAFINYITQILMSLMMLSMAIMGISRAQASADRINEVLDTTAEIINPKNPITSTKSKGSIQFNNVFFSYPDSDGDPILSELDLQIKSGEVLGVFGETGSGKTTFVSLIPRLYDVTSGRVLVDGIDVRDYDLDTLRNKVSIVLQQAILFSGTIKENIKWGNPDATDEQVYEAAKIAQAHDFILQQKDGYDTVIGQMGVNLSGGQKQRVSIARAILKNPEILIFDDSTSAVDMATEAKIQKALKEQMKGCTKIIIAQRISSVVDADKIIILQGGEIKAVGSHTELLQTSEIYNDIYHSQVYEEESDHE